MLYPHPDTVYNVEKYAAKEFTIFRDTEAWVSPSKASKAGAYRWKPLANGLVCKITLLPFSGVAVSGKISTPIADLPGKILLWE